MTVGAVSRRKFISLTSLMGGVAGGWSQSKIVNVEPAAAYWIAKLEAGFGTFDHRLVPSDKPRMEVVYALAAMGDSIVPELRQLLDSDDLYVIFESLIALVQIRTPHAIDAIQMALKDHRPRVRELTIGTLSREWLGDDWLPELWEATHDVDARVRVRALRVLKLHPSCPCTVRKSWREVNALRLVVLKRRCAPAVG